MRMCLYYHLWEWDSATTNQTHTALSFYIFREHFGNLVRANEQNHALFFPKSIVFVHSFAMAYHHQTHGSILNIGIEITYKKSVSFIFHLDFRVRCAHFVSFLNIGMLFCDISVCIIIVLTICFIAFGSNFSCGSKYKANGQTAPYLVDWTRKSSELYLNSEWISFSLSSSNSFLVSKAFAVSVCFQLSLEFEMLTHS